MISYSEYLNWYNDNANHNLNMIAVLYNPKDKTRILNQKHFELENEISDIPLFSELLYKITCNYIGHVFSVQLKDQKYSWYPEWLTNLDIDTKNNKDYLDKQLWTNKIYFGKLVIEDLINFFILFLDYSIKFQYQDILLFSKESDYIIQLSHHGTVWFISPEKEELEKISIELDKMNCTVIPSQFKLG